MKRYLMILASATTAAALANPAAAFTREANFGFDRALGQAQVNHIEGAIEPRRDENGIRQEIRQPFGRPVATATAIGNLISVEAAPGSTVILNALQFNRGNQFAINGELDLD